MAEVPKTVLDAVQHLLDDAASFNARLADEAADSTTKLDDFHLKASAAIQAQVDSNTAKTLLDQARTIEAETLDEQKHTLDDDVTALKKALDEAFADVGE